MFRYLAMVLLLVGGISCDLMDGITPCDNNVPLPLDVYVYGCDSLPCIVHNGDTVYFEMDFLVHEFTPILTANVSIVLGPLQIPFALPEEDQNACNGLIGDIRCPVFSGDVPRYGLGMKVEAPVSGVTVVLEFWLEDYNRKRVVCYRREQRVDRPRAINHEE